MRSFVKFQVVVHHFAPFHQSCEPCHQSCEPCRQSCEPCHGDREFPHFLAILSHHVHGGGWTTQNWNMRYIVNLFGISVQQFFFASFFRMRQKTDPEIKVEPSHSSPESESVPRLAYQFRFQCWFLLSTAPWLSLDSGNERKTSTLVPERRETNNTEEAGLHNPLTFGV